MAFTHHRISSTQLIVILKKDYRAHEDDGIHPVSLHRLRLWRMDICFIWPRVLRSLVYHVTLRHCHNTDSMKLACNVALGRQASLLGAARIGDGAAISQDAGILTDSFGALAKCVPARIAAKKPGFVATTQV